MHRLFVALVAAILCGTSPLTAAPPVPIDAETLSRAFFRTVFGLEYGGHADAYRVKRYVDEVRFHVEDLSERDRLAPAREFLAALPKRISNLKATLVEDPAAANFRVILVAQKDFSQVVQRELEADAFAMNARCLVGVTSLNGRIERSTAVIVADDDFLFARCLVEEVLQGLGPMNDDDRLPQSVFNDTSHHARFTEFDEALMNVLYHPAIRPGMSGTQVQRTLPRVLHELGYSH